MRTAKSAVIFFLLFVSGSFLLREITGEGFSADAVAAILVVGLLAAGMYAAMQRALSK